MTEEKNITHNDMRFLQNDLLNDMKKLELQLNGKVASINQILLTKMGDYDSKFTKIFENITELISQMAERKYDNDRVEELLKMRNKFSDQIIENQSRITIIDKSLEKALFRYDKIILDNLSVPGLIGVGSKFKNCASFFKYVDNEMQINQKFKEEGSTNLKTLTEKVETRLKKAEGDITQILQNVNHICDVKFEKIFHKIEERAISQENMIAQTRIENSRHTTELIKASTELKIQWEKLENIKNEIYARYDEEMEKFKKLVLVTDRNYKKQEVEFNVFKQRFAQLAEYLKDFKNSTKNYKEMVKDINFNKKQKLKDDFDLGKYDEIGENVRDYIKSPFPNRKKNELDIDSQEDNKDDNIYEKNANRKNFKRSSLSPSPRKTTIFMKKKKMTELEKINKIAKEGNKRLSNVFTFKNKLKELNDANNNNNSVVKKNLNYFYKTDLKRKSDLTTADLNEGKKNLKTLKRKKTIVTENNIDLNFDTNKEEDKELSKEESENSSFSSNFSLSSIISLKKIGDESKEDEKKEIKEQDKDKEENIELYSDREVKNSEGENTYKSKKTQTEKRSEENQTSTFREKNINISEKNIQKNLGRDNSKKVDYKKNEINSIKKENINNKKENNSGLNKTPTNSKEITKKKKEQEIQNKAKNKIKPIEKQLKINISKEKSSKINQIINKKGNSRNISKKVFGFEKDNIKQDNKTTTKNNLITLNNEIKKEASIDKMNQAKTISVFNKQIKQAMNEYTNKKSNPITKAVPNRINTEVTFPQIKLKSNEIYKAQNSQPQILKLMSNTPKENRKIKNKLILETNNNIKPNFYKALISNQRLDTNNNYENKDTLSVSLEKKEEKEINEINDINSIEREKEEKNDEVKEKEENNNATPTNYGNEQEEKSNINIKGLFNSLYDEIKEIKEITNNNNANKEKEIINNKNAFLTSLNQVNNNYNYYYNDSNENQAIPIANPQTKKEIDDETIKKFNNEIDFINGNIKLVNHRITTLENRYQLILNQLNNIFNTVSSYYHHHKRKMEQHASMRLNNKKGINRGRSIDYQKEEDILSDKKFMLKLKDMYNDDYENNEEYRLKIPNDEYNKTLRKIEPFLIKKFKNG